MATIGIFENLTLDGVIQGSGRPDEDTRDGFDHGGWGEGFQDETMMRFAGEGMSRAGGMLLGRRTYEDLLGFWTSTPEPNPFAAHLLATPKYVVTRDPEFVAAHANTSVLRGEASETVRTLRQETDTHLTVLGSGELVRTLHRAGLIEEYALQIYPIVLGSGRRLFDSAGRVDLELIDSAASTTGVVLARYRRA